MRRPVLLVLAFLFAAAFAGFVGWAFFAAGRLGSGWQSLGPVWPYVAGGVLATGALTGVLLWLAFYSSNHGFDDRIDSR